ncbi:hypothetical protein O0L34_g13929 [Tuta absoluta]|nr:hypothetical protein O0L34_g13929 [Tuta absoluta]
MSSILSKSSVSGKSSIGGKSFSQRMSRTRISSNQVPLALDNMRLAQLADAVYILPLCTEPMLKTFRISCIEDIEYLIENSVFALTQLDVEGNVVGFMCLREYPVVPSIDPSAWEEYIWAKYKTIELTARNTLWIHLVCWKRCYGREVLDTLMRAVYMQDSYMLHICMIKTILSCHQLVPGTSRAEACFRRVQAMERGMPGEMLPTLLIADRVTLCPRLRVRRAVEEDNDDLVPIIERHSERLRDMYGDFYISELIARHPESERALLVCEHKEVAVGVMILNTQINFESLEECFELAPFAGLRNLDRAPHKHKLSNDTASNLSQDVIPESNYTSSFYQDSNTSFFEDERHTSRTNVTSVLPLHASTSQHIRLAEKSEVIGEPTLHLMDLSQREYTAEEKERMERDRVTERVLYSAEDGKVIGNVSVLQYYDRYTDEEEDVDFDIVNIDPELLRVPYLDPTKTQISKNLIEGRTKELVETDGGSATTLKKEKRDVPKPPEYIIRYTGTSNAFLLELCAMHHDYDERNAFDMLEAAFELFPDRDYCIMSLPSNHPPFPLLEHFTLVTPHSTRMRFMNESLYVAHVNSVRGDVSVRPGEMADMVKLNDLFEHAAKLDTLVMLFEKALKSRVLHTFMLLSEKQPIGCVILGPLEDGVNIRTQYDLHPEPRWQLADGAIIAATMSPIMEPHARWFLRDLMRQTRYCSLFWVAQPFGKGEMSPIRNLMSLAERMMPVKPRESLPNISGSKLVDRLFEDMSTPFALWMIERPMTSYPKVNVNNSIVVVGASRTGLAFIEYLILGESSRYLSFTNITLVSDHGLPAVAECLKAADTAIPKDGRYDDHYLKCLPFVFYIDIISSVLVEIDRKQKCIYLANGGLKFYDELVITVGHQFQHPDYLKQSLDIVKQVQKGRPCERILMDNPKYRPDKVPPAPAVPGNLFLINSLLQANQVLRKLLLMMQENKEDLTERNRIAVYGDCLESYCCMAALLELGVPGNHIAFIENFPPEDPTALRVNCFNDETVDERVQDRLAELGIKCYRNCRITKLDIKDKKVRSVSLIDPVRQITVPCYALFYYGRRAIDINAFKAINECGLVYDGGLVVGPMFETNDPSIYGAGPCCNYSRRLYAAHHNHKYYNTEEVGEALAEIFLHKYDPFISHNPLYSANDLMPYYRTSLYSRSHASIATVNISREHLIAPPLGRNWQPVMKFKSALSISATLPGSLYYFKSRKPGPDIPMGVQLSLPHQGHTLTTNRNDNYFRLRLNVLHVVDAVTCLSRRQFSGDVLAKLYGKHEAVFHKLLLRFQLGQIDDLYSYFVQPWLSIIYQDTFAEMMVGIEEHEIGPMLEKLNSTYPMFDVESKPKERERKVTLQPAGTGAPVRRSLRSAVMYTFSQMSQSEDERDTRIRGKLRETVTNFATRTNVQLERLRKPADIPTECGQCAALREEVAAFWDAVGGERIVHAHMGKHLEKYTVPNPQYAMPQTEFYRIRNDSVDAKSTEDLNDDQRV